MQSENRKSFNLWVFFGGVIIAILFCFIFSGLIWVFPIPKAPEKDLTSVLAIIPAPSQTPIISVKTTQTPTNNQQENKQVISLGAYVKIFDTGDAGLRIRASAGVSGSIKFIASDLELFQVKEGPVEADGYIWWYIVAPYDSTRSGWAAANYLKISTP